MKKLIFILLLFVSFGVKAQYNFPSLDSLRKYCNRFITNSAINAFTDYRLNTLLNGMIAWIDSAGGGSSGVDSIWAINDSTIRYRKGLSLINVTIKGGRDVDTIYRKAGQDSLFFTINGIERAVKDSGGVAGLTIQEVVNYGNHITDNNDSIIVDDGKVFTIHGGNSTTGSTVHIKAASSASNAAVSVMPTGINLLHRNLSSGFYKGIQWSSASNSGISILDQIDQTGLGYAGNYKTNGIANLGNRWIPDWQAVNEAINDSADGLTWQRTLTNGSTLTTNNTATLGNNWFAWKRNYQADGNTMFRFYGDTTAYPNDSYISFMRWHPYPESINHNTNMPTMGMSFTRVALANPSPANGDSANYVFKWGTNMDASGARFSSRVGSWQHHMEHNYQAVSYSPGMQGEYHITFHNLDNTVFRLFSMNPGLYGSNPGYTFFQARQIFFHDDPSLDTLWQDMRPGAFTMRGMAANPYPVISLNPYNFVTPATINTFLRYNNDDILSIYGDYAKTIQIGTGSKRLTLSGQELWGCMNDNPSVPFYISQATGGRVQIGQKDILDLSKAKELAAGKFTIGYYDSVGNGHSGNIELSSPDGGATFQVKDAGTINFPDANFITLGPNLGASTPGWANISGEFWSRTADGLNWAGVRTGNLKVNGTSIFTGSGSLDAPFAYSSNFHSLLTGHSLIDRDYLDSIVAGLSLTYGNWLTNSSGATVKVGGDITENTTLNAHNNFGVTFDSLANMNLNVRSGISGTFRVRQGGNIRVDITNSTSKLNSPDLASFITVTNGIGGFTQTGQLDINATDSVKVSGGYGLMNISVSRGFRIEPPLGKLYIDSLEAGASIDSILTWNTSTQQVRYRSLEGAVTTLYSGNGSIGSERTITGGSNTTTWTGTQSSLSVFNVSNTGNGSAGAFSTTGTGSALSGTNSSSGNGLFGSSSSGNGLSATSVTGLAGRFKITPSSTNTVVDVMDIIRGSSGTMATGGGGLINMKLTDDGGNDVTGIRIGPVFTSAATGSTTTDLQIFTTNAGSSTLKFTLKGNGQQRLHNYGVSTFTGTATTSAQFDVNGNIIEGPAVTSGTYTPTLTNTTNVAASTAYQFQWSRVGNTITFSGEVDIDPTSGLTLTVLTMTLPIVGSFANPFECAGTAADDLGTVARVRATASAGTAEVRMTPSDVTNRRFSVHGTYLYIAP